MGYELSDEAVVSFMEQCPHLEAVYLDGCATDEVLSALAQHCGRRLRHLGLVGSACAAKSGAQVAECTALETLYCSDDFVSLADLIAAQSTLKEVCLDNIVITKDIVDALSTLGEAICSAWGCSTLLRWTFPPWSS